MAHYWLSLLDKPYLSWTVIDSLIFIGPIAFVFVLIPGIYRIYKVRQWEKNNKWRLK